MKHGRKWVTHDGLKMLVGGRLWRWWRRHKGSIVGNPALNKPPHGHGLTFEHKIVALCHLSLEFAGRMVYSEGPDRANLFSRPVGRFADAHADCSQYVASILHWLGVKVVNAGDWTGTLWHKGKMLKKPKAGCVAIWGGYPGQHTAFVTEHIPGGSDWWVVGFGHQGAPDRVKLSDMSGYFEANGHPGVRFLDFGA